MYVLRVRDFPDPMTSPGWDEFCSSLLGKNIWIPKGFLGCCNFQVCGEPAKIIEVVFHSHFSHFFFCVQLDVWGKVQLGILAWKQERIQENGG